MSRDALVVGISNYTHLNPLGEVPANDAEAIAQILESGSSPFKVTRLPAVIDNTNDALKTGVKTKVLLNQLETALEQLFNPEGKNHPDTALFYFSGHGIYKKERGYLATSDTDPNGNDCGYRLTDLLELVVKKSPIKRQIIWLDCCNSGSLIVLNGDQNGYSRCFVTSSREHEEAFQLASGSHGVLTDAILKGLEQEQGGDCIDTLSLCAYINRHLRDVDKTYPQRPLFLNVGEPLDLIYRKDDIHFHTIIYLNRY